MIHTFAGDFTNLFELVATITVCVIPLFPFLRLWYDEWRDEREKTKQNKKAS
jgi:hypothetical protein